MLRGRQGSLGNFEEDHQPARYIFSRLTTDYFKTLIPWLDTKQVAKTIMPCCQHSMSELMRSFGVSTPYIYHNGEIAVMEVGGLYKIATKKWFFPADQEEYIKRLNYISSLQNVKSYVEDDSKLFIAPFLSDVFLASADILFNAPNDQAGTHIAVQESNSISTLAVEFVVSSLFDVQSIYNHPYWNYLRQTKERLNGLTLFTIRRHLLEYGVWASPYVLSKFSESGVDDLRDIINNVFERLLELGVIVFDNLTLRGRSLDGTYFDRHVLINPFPNLYPNMPIAV